MKLRRELLAAGAILALLAATNRWLGWDDGIHLLSLSDVRETYQVIAESFPGWPGELVPFHKAQRFLIPYLLGGIAKVGIGVPVVFSLFTLLCGVGGVALLLRAMRAAAVPERTRWAALVLFCFQPYVFRYYILAPGMGLDLAFVAGMGLIILALLQTNAALLLAGALWAGMSRQTALLLVPGVFYFLWRDAGWKEKSRFLVGAAFAAIVGLVYIVSSKLAVAFALPNTNLAVLTGIFDPSQTENPRALAEHAVRCFLPLAGAGLALLFARPSWRDTRVVSFVLMGLAVLSQPVLAGPGITGQNGGRLASMALLPFVVAWAVAEKKHLSLKRLGLIAGFAFWGSFHHIYTWIGPNGPIGSALFQTFAALGIGATLMLAPKDCK